jgi:hypothetical protein
MRLADASRFFDRTVCADAYAPARTFLAQLDLFDDSKRDGGTVARRVLSVAPDVALPARGVFTAHGDTYILGAGHPDSFNGAVVRKKYVSHRADGLATIMTLDQAIRSLAGGSSAYGARLWVKDQKEIQESSRLNAFFAMYFAPIETVPIGSVVALAGRWHLVRQSFVSAAGFLMCEADELPLTALSSIVYTDRTAVYDAANDALTTSQTPTIPALWHRFQAGFDYLQESAVQLPRRATSR